MNAHGSSRRSPSRAEDSRSDTELSLGKKLAFSAITVVSFLLVVEMGVRLIGFQFNPYQHYKSLQDLWELREENDTVIYTADSELFWRLTPGMTLPRDTVYAPEGTRVNSLGFRGESVETPKPADTFRIVCYGDSGTFGWGVADGETYPAQLQNILRQRYPDLNVDVVNAGVPGYTTLQGLRLLRRTIDELQPDLIILRFGSNDVIFHSMPDKDRIILPDWIVRSMQSLTNLRIFQLGYWTVANVRGDLPPEDPKARRKFARRSPRVEARDFVSNLLEAINVSNQHDARVLLLPRFWYKRPLTEHYWELLQRVSMESNALYYDFSDKGDRQQKFIDFHPGPEIYREMAAAIADFLAGRGVLPASSS